MSAFDEGNIIMDPPPLLRRPPGKNPFHLKGLSIAGQIDFIKERAPGRFEAIIDSISDPAIREYVRQPFVASG